MTEKRAAAAILFLLFLCIPFATVYGEDSSAVYYCSTIQDVCIRLEEYPGSTLVLTGDIEVADTWDLTSVSVPTKILMENYSIHILEDAALSIDGPVSFQGRGKSQTLFIVDGSLSTSQGVEICALGEQSTAVSLSQSGMWQSDITTVSVYGPDSTGLFLADGRETELMALRIQAMGENAAAITSRGPLRLSLCSISSLNGPSIDSSCPVILEQCDVTPVCTKAEVIPLYAAVTDPGITDNGLCFPLGTPNSSITDGVVDYQLLTDSQELYGLSYLAAARVEEEEDYSLPGSYTATMVPQVPDWFPITLPPVTFPIHIVRPGQPFLKAAYDLGDSVGIQYFSEIADASVITLLYSQDGGLSWKDSANLPGSYADAYGAQIKGLDKTIRYYFCLKVEGGSQEGVSNYLPFSFGSPNYFGGGDNDGGDRTDQSFPAVEQPLPELPDPPVEESASPLPSVQDSASPQEKTESPDSSEPSSASPAAGTSPRRGSAPSSEENDGPKEESTETTTTISGRRLNHLLSANPSSILFEKQGISLEIPSDYLAGLHLEDHSLLSVTIIKIDSLSFQLFITAGEEELKTLPEVSVSLPYCPAKGTDPQLLKLVDTETASEKQVFYNQREKIASANIDRTGTYCIQEFQAAESLSRPAPGGSLNSPVLFLFLAAAILAAIFLKRRTHERT
jgi:hypothetical protein